MLLSSFFLFLHANSAVMPSAALDGRGGFRLLPLLLLLLAFSPFTSSLFGSLFPP